VSISSNFLFVADNFEARDVLPCVVLHNFLSVSHLAVHLLARLLALPPHPGVLEILLHWR